MLTSINAYTAQITNNRPDTVSTSEESASSAEVSLKENASSAGVVKESVAPAGKNLFLSSRAEKVNAISTEFFNKGVLSSVDIDKLVERAYEYGLISKADYSHLTKPSATEESGEVQAETLTASLADFIENFQHRFNSADAKEQKKEDSNDEPSKTEIEMNKALSSALNILSDVEQAKKADDFQQSISHAIATLSEVVQSDSFSQLPLDDRVGLSKSVKALETIDKLTPQKQTNQFINRYLDMSLK
ncbi:hypothetical protein SG34_022270 [Thalassomonas viridans]|uniref:Uncharacterized protein n=1 Tax=Thalassomonas viridans TaxID=137584 RepID=A0AAF0C7U5_9GAMM|nr:hypothetical protein [Thalassomonas viridans]WDE04063.1 hypothetical protein SG34_022270 [Thalassomonas viridans]